MKDRDDPRQQPVAKATTSIAEGNAPVVATFSSAGSTAPSGVIKSYLWEFDDDGSESTEASPIHTFNDAGTYNVKLTVTDDVGLKGVAIVQVKAIILGTLPPKVSFVQPPQQFAPANITFNATAVTYGGSSVAGYLWSFGDGETSTAESPTHT
ncbi:MAG: PKD domain-containing protein [Candidatus Microthrix sp.]|nr:PKD domain-containing protein [Candidatus Microthrix sp.]